MKNIFSLVDCNSFYASCEQVFRPDLKNRPVVVLSNNDGAIVAANKEAKALGLKMFGPYFKVQEQLKKHNVAVFSSNYELYADLSRRVVLTLEEFTPELEVYSIDESFLDLSGMNKNFYNYGWEIKKTVEKRTGIPVGVGVAPTKVLAKLANHLAKKSEGVCDLTDKRNHDDALKKTPISDVWGVGWRSATKMKALGIHTAHDLKNYKNDRIIQRTFNKLMRQVQDELRGISCMEFEQIEPKRKEIVSSRSFGAPVFSLEDLKESIANRMSIAAEKLRRQDSVCSLVSVSIRTNPYKEVPQYKNYAFQRLQGPTCDTRKLIVAAHIALEKIYKKGYEYKKSMVMLGEIRDTATEQLEIFGESDSKEEISLMKSMDYLNVVYGKGTLKSLACGVDDLKPWVMRRKLMGPRYTTRWDELLRVKLS